MAIPVRDQTRIAVAFVALPVVAAVTAWMIFPVIYARPEAGYGHTVTMTGLPLAARIGVVTGLASLPLVAVGVGSLCALVLWRRRPVRLRHALAAGALIGNAPWAFFFALAWMHSPPDHASPEALLDPELWRPVTFGAAIGLACATAFWALAGRSARQALATAEVDP